MSNIEADANSVARPFKIGIESGPQETQGGNHQYPTLIRQIPAAAVGL